MEESNNKTDVESSLKPSPISELNRNVEKTNEFYDPSLKPSMKLELVNI